MTIVVGYFFSEKSTLKYCLDFACLDSCSKFEDIFDEEYFTEILKDHVRVVKELPPDILQRFDNNISNILNMRSRALQSKTYYLEKVLPKLIEFGYVLNV